MPGSAEQRYRFRDHGPGVEWVEVPTETAPGGWDQVGMVEKMLAGQGWQAMNTSGNDIGPCHPSKAHAALYLVDRYYSGDGAEYVQDVT